jgi:hypothetical protein
MISSLKIKLNRSWKFQRNWNVPLVLLERSWWAGFNEIYLVRFRFRMWEILILNWFLLLKIQINSKKGKEKSVEDLVTVGPTPHATLVYLWRKVFCLFCLYLWDPPNQDASDHILGHFGKLLRRRGAWAWFHDVWTCGAEVLEYGMISSLKID